MGMSKAVHVLQRDAEVSDIVNMSAIAAVDAQEKEKAGPKKTRVGAAA